VSYYRPQVALSNDEIEVACGALWSVKRWAGWDDDQERLWERLRPIRTGDYGGEFEDDETIFAESATPAARAVVAAEAADGSSPRGVAGLRYLLEVALAREAIEVWRAWRPGRPSLEDKLAAVTYYAEHDTCSRSIDRVRSAMAQLSFAHVTFSYPGPGERVVTRLLPGRVAA
jgi:hypothetical protein